MRPEPPPSRHRPTPDPAVALVHSDVGWLRFRGPRGEVVARQPGEVLDALGQVEEAARAGLCAVGYVAYEAAAAFDAAFSLHRAPTDLPLVCFVLFEGWRPAAPPWSPGEGPGPAWDLSVGESRRHYLQAVESIRAGIAEGSYYQVNHTFPLRLRIVSSPEAAAGPEPESAQAGDALFRRLCRGQGAAFGTHLRHRGLEVCSASPELFFERHGDRVTTRPMKGTAPRGRFGTEDEAIAGALAGSAKDRAENLMIVDMLRNDLGRIARPGSVRVPRLFEVERLPTLHQMTSTVTASSVATLPELFAALFPCASVTGAPKVSAMAAIHALEAAPRGVYTGAVGMVLPRAPVAGNPDGDATREGSGEPPYARFNVAIRTAWRTGDGRAFRYGVGSGVVWDSDPAAEYRECRIKALAVTQRRPAFRLLETMLLGRPRHGHEDVTRRIRLWREHLARLSSSARYFDYHLEPDRIVEAIADAVADSGLLRARIRLLVDADGAAEVQLTPADAAAPRRPLGLAWARNPVDSSDPFLFHKTTHRDVYEGALADARRAGADDALLWNERGEVTETAIANVLVPPARPGAPWRTPPREAGLLDGTLRRALLRRGRLIEATIRREDLVDGSPVVLANSVRGLVPAIVGTTQQPTQDAPAPPATPTRRGEPR